MSNKKESKSNNWRINYQDRKEYYESQEAAIIAVNLIISSCESGIWGENSYLYLSHERGEAVDRDLFSIHYSANVLLPTSFDDMFTIDLFVKIKKIGFSSMVRTYFSSQSSLAMNAMMGI